MGTKQHHISQNRNKEEHSGAHPGLYCGVDINTHRSFKGGVKTVHQVQIVWKLCCQVTNSGPTPHYFFFLGVRADLYFTFELWQLFKKWIAFYELCHGWPEYIFLCKHWNPDFLEEVGFLPRRSRLLVLVTKTAEMKAIMCLRAIFVCELTGRRKKGP